MPRSVAVKRKLAREAVVRLDGFRNGYARLHSLLDQANQMAEVVRAEHDVHMLELLLELFAVALADAAAKGIRLIDATPRKGAEGMTIAFLHPKSTQGILTELCENKNK